MHFSEAEDKKIRESLTDMNEDQHFKRERADSNDVIELPPLPDYDDNKDNDALNDLNQNYRSNGCENSNSIDGAKYSNAPQDTDEDFERDLNIDSELMNLDHAIFEKEVR